MTSPFPEHDKLTQVKDQTQAIGEFIDWCAEQQIALVQWSDGETYPVNLMDLLAEWAGIDRNRLEAEKREMLATLRRMNGADT